MFHFSYRFSHIDFLCFSWFFALFQYPSLRMRRLSLFHHVCNNPSQGMLFFRELCQFQRPNTLMIAIILWFFHCFELNFLSQQHQNSFPHENLLNFLEELLVTSRWPSPYRSKMTSSPNPPPPPPRRYTYDGWRCNEKKRETSESIYYFN